MIMRVLLLYVCMMIKDKRSNAKLFLVLELLEKFLFEVANPWIFCPQTQFEVARLPQKWEYPWVRCEGVISK